MASTISSRAHSGSSIQAATSGSQKVAWLRKLSSIETCTCCIICWLTECMRAYSVRLRRPRSLVVCWGYMQTAGGSVVAAKSETLWFRTCLREEKILYTPQSQRLTICHCVELSPLSLSERLSSTACVRMRATFIYSSEARMPTPSRDIPFAL